MNFITNKNGFLTQERIEFVAPLTWRIGVFVFFFSFKESQDLNHSISKEKLLIWKHDLSIRNTREAVQDKYRT